MLVLVTGGAGRLGITVCRMLQKKGFRVRVFDLPSPRNRRSVRELGSKVEVHWGDITNADSVGRAVEGVDAVIHMAGILPPVTEANPALAEKVNVRGTQTLVDAVRATGKRMPFVFTSSVAVFGPTPAATEPVSVERNAPNPRDIYGVTKLKAENLIRESGIGYIILRLSASMYTIFEARDLKRVYGIPLENRVELCHPEEVSLAIVNAVVNFEAAKGNTLIISGGPKGRMLYKDMIRGILSVLRLPLPPARKFTQQPFYLDYYDTSKSQLLLQYQHKTFGDYLGDFRTTLARRFTPAFLPFMCYFVGPLFGKIVMRLI
ncbi:MAG: NAD(P)-dependent oxidoreductase [Dehalococcoidia bacterium]|nr:NAD(P)-dependent oxidoreductase [Dehalococcoidia bacterium]